MCQNMSEKSEICCVCTQNDSNLIEISTRDTNGITFVSKLSSCVPEVNWPADFLLCQKCTEYLEVGYTFRQLCLQSEIIQQLSVDKSMGVKEEATPLLPEYIHVRPLNVEMKAESVICYHCNKQFENKTVLSEHMKTHNDDTSKSGSVKQFCCNKCGKQYISSSKMQMHRNICNGNKRNLREKQNNKYKCTGIIITSEKDIDDGDINEDDDVKVETSINDDSCREDVEVEEVVPRKKPCPKYEYPCELCPEIFKSGKRFTDHIQKVHDKDPRVFKPFRCTKCGNRYVRDHTLHDHLRQHDNPGNNICSYCGKIFKTRIDLKFHEDIHLNMRSNRCEICDKGFNTYKNLRTHNLIKHRDPSTWKHYCSICDKKFPIKSNFDCHMRRHTGDKRYICHVCQKSFVTNKELNCHLLSHSNVRKFKCCLCDKEYKEKQVLDLHLTKAHGIGNRKLPNQERKHSCSFCPKAFHDKNKLRRHLCTHTGERPFACHLCDKKFTDKSYVTQHLKGVHNIFNDD